MKETHKEEVFDPNEKTASTDAKNLWTKEFISISLVHLATFASFNMITTGIPVYVKTLGASDVIVGLVTTFTTVAALITRPFSGLVLDRFGRKWILLIGLGIMFFIITSYAMFPILAVILFLRLLHGATWGVSSTATSTIVADIIPRKRFAEGMGYFALVTAIATAIAPALSIGILERGGIIPMITISATSCSVAFVLALLQRPVNIKGANKGKKITVSDLFDKRAAFPGGIIFLMNCAFGSIITFVALHGQSKGVDNIWLYFTSYAIVTLISRPITGRIIDKVGFFIPGILSALGVAITLLIIASSYNIIMFCIAGVFAGIGIGTGMGTLQTMAVSSVPSDRRGVATATYFLGFDAGIGAGAIIAGGIAGKIGYSNMYLVMMIFPLLAFCIFLIVGKKRIASYSVK